MNEKEILEEFDKLGQMIIKDRECGDMPYSELANWSVIKAFISKSLSDQREKEYNRGFEDGVQAASDDILSRI